MSLSFTLTWTLGLFKFLIRGSLMKGKVGLKDDIWKLTTKRMMRLGIFRLSKLWLGYFSSIKDSSLDYRLPYKAKYEWDSCKYKGLF